MSNFFLILLILSILAFFLGLVAPITLKPVFRKKPQRKKVFKVFGSSILIFFILVGISSDFESGKQKDLFEQVNVAIEDSEPEKALKLVQEANKIGDDKNLELENQLIRLLSQDFLIRSLVSLNDEQLKQLEIGKLEHAFFSDSNLNSIFLHKLKDNIDNRDQFVKGIKIAEAKAKENAKRLAKEKRGQEIESQFSAWDGSHVKLTRFIKNAMHDPSSYEHVKTVYWDKDDHLVVQTTYRGANAFGGVVMSGIKAKISLNGDVLQILEGL